MNCKGRVAIDWLALWIVFSAWCSLSGWALGLTGNLNAWGYCVAFLLLLAGLVLFRREFELSQKKQALFRAVRFRWFVPKLWLGLTLLAVAGGALYHPNNYDYLTYRFPRVLNWCWEGKWFWIHTDGMRMNYSATGFEWLMAPLFVFFKTDRLFFLINCVSFLFCPALVFSVFTGLGISRRVSWWWMWVLPSGYCYILQAASVGNDLFASVYLLAAFHFLFRAREASSVRNLALSLLAIGLVTGAKASNIPLALPWLVVLFFNRENLLRPFKPAIWAAAMVVSALVSFLPLALLNIHYTGDYSGDPQNRGKMKLANPVCAMAGNVLTVGVYNLVSPVMPREVSLNGVLPSNFKTWLLNGYPRLNLTVGELQIEEAAGVGVGVTAFAGLALACGLWARRARPDLLVPGNGQSLWIAAASSVALLAYMAKMGSEAAPRLLAAYYPMMIAGLLAVASLDGAIVRRFIWKLTGVAAIASAFPIVILSPSRPMLPVNLISNEMTRWGVSPALVTRFDQVYRIYLSRSDNLRAIRGSIPLTESRVGFCGADDPEVSLWLPFGSRQVINVKFDETADQLRADRLHYVVVNSTALENVFGVKIDELMARWHATVVLKKDIVMKAHRGAEPWYLLYCP